MGVKRPDCPIDPISVIGELPHRVATDNPTADEHATLILSFHANCVLT